MLLDGIDQTVYPKHTVALAANAIDKEFYGNDTLSRKIVRVYRQIRNFFDSC